MYVGESIACLKTIVAVQRTTVAKRALLLKENKGEKSKETKKKEQEEGKIKNKKMKDGK